MSERIHGLAQLLPDKSSLDDYTLEELQHAAKRYPYFAPLQFLLLQKMKEEALPETEVQQQKTALYYNDPILFDYFISPDRFTTNDQALAPMEEEAFTSIDVAEDATADDSFVAGQSMLLAPQTKIDDEAETGQVVEGVNSETYSVINPEPAAVTTDEPSSITTPFPEPDKVSLADSIETNEPIVLPAQDLRQNPSGNADPVIQESATEPADNSLSLQPETPEANTAAPALIVEEPADGDNTESELSLQSKGEEMAPEAAIQSAEAPPAQEPLAFEPFHTVDYFASQGIRIAADELPKDKLSKQLRSFTEWLRIMKRLPAAEVALSPETLAEKSVESLASHSVEGGDVVTEAMAEVWARQGNRQKAIETYNKLSLQNPSKRTYFAAKIENLS